MYAVVFRVDVPTTQSQPIESTQGTLPIPQRRSTRLTPPTPIPATAEADDIILQDIIQLSLAEQNRAENVEKVNVNSSNLKQDDTQTIPGTRLEPKSDKESLEVEITAEVQLVNINKEEEESVEDDYELKRRKRRSMLIHQSGIICQLALKYEFEKLHMATIPCRPSAVRPRDQDDPHDDAHPKGENSTKRQKTSKHGTFMFRESSSGQDFESDQGPSMLGNQEQLDDFDFWMDSYATEDDEIPYKKVSQELVDEISHTVDEAKLRKVVDEMLRQQCTSGDEHQYHINHMQNFLKNDIVSCTALVNQDLLHLKKGSSSPEKIVMSLHKFPVFIFPDDDIEERTSRWELGHERKFITKIVARRANGSIVSITKSDCKNLNKNDIEDMYLLIVNHKVDNYAETGLLWSLSVFIRSTNSKKEKRVMRHQEVYKLCDATLKRVLEVLKSYNNDVKHGYVSQSLSNKDAEYLQLFEEEIEERLKHRDQMIR
ncbi:hypothetical protein Tco_0332551 [Tanacetum coccineum]